MVSPAPSIPLIELRALSKSYREGDTEHRVLDRVEAHIGHGELVVLLGRSGSGKSTLLNLIGGIDSPTSGEVLIDGLSLGALSEQARTLFRRRYVGFVFQSFNLIPTLTVEENLLLPLELNGLTGRDAHDRALHRLEVLGLAARRASYPDRLSGGEQQRVAIARALVHEPVLVLADEPTGNLDLETGRSVVAALDRATRAAGKTLVMVTHSREVVGQADRVLSLTNGRLSEQPKMQ